VAVVVPARDEADRIEATLRGLEAARRQVAKQVSCAVVVVADRCRDDTAARARALLVAPDVVVEIEAGCVGVARRLGTALALRRSPAPTTRTWLASTDADTVVPEGWLAPHLFHAERGAVGVAGIVELRADEAVDRVLAERFASTYELDHGRGLHPHVHGANLGVRADAYLRAGGWARLPVGEDQELWSRLREVGPVVSTIDSRVATSGRRQGRADHGFAAELEALMESVA
jgi:glycosyltransferase involved in cell wall biosynthesis